VSVALKANFKNIKEVGKSFGRRSFFFVVLEMRVDSLLWSGMEAVQLRIDKRLLDFLLN
jgi:hypothetical protein